MLSNNGPCVMFFACFCATKLTIEVPATVATMAVTGQDWLAMGNTLPYHESSGSLEICQLEGAQLTEAENVCCSSTPRHRSLPNLKSLWLAMASAKHAKQGQQGATAPRGLLCPLRIAHSHQDVPTAHEE